MASLDEPDLIVGAKVASPLVVGIGDGENLLASDIPAVLPRTRTVVPVEEGQIVELRAEGVRISTFDGIEVEPPVLGSDLDTFGRGTPEAEQDERGSPHAHTFAEIWQGEEPSLVFLL